jgi:nucleotide-binding universal stress UspA family protein
MPRACAGRHGPADHIGWLALKKVPRPAPVCASNLRPEKESPLLCEADIPFGILLATDFSARGGDSHRAHHSQKQIAMNAPTILYPTDFSELGKSALDLATSLARDRGARLLIVHVEEPPIAYGGGELYYGVEEPDRGLLQRMLANVVPLDAAVHYEHRLLSGSPARAIVQCAETESVDMIVMPTHGRTGLLRLLMGSVAEEVVRKAKCPVLTVKGVVRAPAKAVAS